MKRLDPNEAGVPIEVNGTVVLVHPLFAQAAGYVAGELRRDEYGLAGMCITEGDLVVDVGGHVGMFASYVALHYGAKVVSFEPFRANHAHQQWVRKRNGLDGRLFPVHAAVTCDGRTVTLRRPSWNTGGGSIHSAGRTEGIATTCRSLTPSAAVAAALAATGATRVRVLKIDSEGSEGEFAALFPWGTIDGFVGELHDYAGTRAIGFDPHAFVADIRARGVRVGGVSVYRSDSDSFIWGPVEPYIGPEDDDFDW